METEEMFYEVVVGDFKLWYNALLVSEEAKSKGLSTTVCNCKDKYCVAAGKYSDEATAKLQLEKVQESGYVFAYIFRRNT